MSTPYAKMDYEVKPLLMVTYLEYQSLEKKYNEAIKEIEKLRKKLESYEKEDEDLRTDKKAEKEDKKANKKAEKDEKKATKKAEKEEKTKEKELKKTEKKAEKEQKKDKNVYANLGIGDEPNSLLEKEEETKISTEIEE